MTEPRTHDWSDELDGQPARRRTLLDALTRLARSGDDCAWVARELCRLVPLEDRLMDEEVGSWD